MRTLTPKLLLCACLFLCNYGVKAQRIFVNSFDAVYELTGGVGSCTYTSVPGFCVADYGGHIYSSALYKDTLYFLSQRGNELYRVKLGAPGTCARLTSFTASGPGGSSLNAMTVDKNGILYFVDFFTRDLIKFNPYTGQKTTLGQVPKRPGGDLIFWEGKLLLSTEFDGIYEINLDAPETSTQYMPLPSNFNFYGLISFPFECSRNKIYGFAAVGGTTELVELDLDTRSVIGVVCTLPFVVFDGASTVENGNTIGISIDSMLFQAPCNAEQQTGNVRIVGNSASPGELTYTLDGSVTNTDGIFSNISLGVHHLKISTQSGCSKDTSFTMTHGLSPDVQLTITDPVSCDLRNGSITVKAFSNYPPLTYSLNNGPPQASNQFNDLGGGLYRLTIRDQGGCRRDTSIAMKYQVRPDFINSIALQPAICESKTGSITVQVNGNPSDISIALNNGQPVSQLQFNDLAAGQYLLSVLKTNGCTYDTVVNILKLTDAKPAIRITTNDQVCFDNNGKISLSVTGQGAPFSFNFNNTGFSSNATYEKLAPGLYPITIRNARLCSWDTLAEIIPYKLHPVTFNVGKTDPNCKELNSGNITVHVTGPETPYFLKWNDQAYANGASLPSGPGNFKIPILNKDYCAVDSADATLLLITSPECDNVYIPNAFTPNNDRRNETFKPVHSPYIKNMQLKIYNRYGQLVFSNSPTRAGWDGSINGYPASAGTYVWTISYETLLGARRNLRGYVLLIR